MMSTSLEQTVETSRSRFAHFSRSDVEQSIPARFERQARMYPDQIAIEDPETALTYRDLNRLANRIARAVLAVRGAGPEPVALLLGNGVPVVAAMLGVLKAGKFYVALDASQPLAGMAAILAETRPALLIADNPRMDQAEQAEALCPVPGLPGVPLLNFDALEPGLSEENPGLAISAASLAFVLYTSGSTGKPKGNRVLLRPERFRGSPPRLRGPCPLPAAGGGMGRAQAPFQARHRLPDAPSSDRAEGRRGPLNGADLRHVPSAERIGHPGRRSAGILRRCGGKRRLLARHQPSHWGRAGERDRGRRI